MRVIVRSHENTFFQSVQTRMLALKNTLQNQNLSSKRGILYITKGLPFLFLVCYLMTLLVLHVLRN